VFYKFSQLGETKKEGAKGSNGFFCGSIGHTMRKKILKSPYLKNRSQQENYVGPLQKALCLYNLYIQEMMGQKELKAPPLTQYMACTL